MRKEMLENQMEELTKTLTNAKTHQEKFAELDGKNDEDFLRFYHLLVQVHITDATEESTLNSLVPQDIPLVLEDCSGNLRSLGTVGGGTTPTNLTVAPCDNRCNLFKLQWSMPEGSDDPEEFCVSGATSANFPTCTLPKVVSGKSLGCFVDNFVPGFNYRFRIQSRNKASWGTCSTPTPEVCRDFPIKVGYTRLVHRVVLPEDGTYRITAKGAKGGNASESKGGHGAVVSATFLLKARDTLIVLSGGKSEEFQGTSGGGGGSFVALNDVWNLLLVAGGGGGARGICGGGGCDASLETVGTSGRGGGKGGQDGGPGEDVVQSDGGCGFGGAGVKKKSTTALSFLEGGEGGQCGGFGGGGAAHFYAVSPKEGTLDPKYCLVVGSGGGGGYSGVGGGGGYSGGGGGGGGGGSFVRDDGTNVEKRVGHNDNGSIVIEKCGVDHPAGATRQESSASSGSNGSYSRACSS